MRIIAGRWKRRVIDVPDVQDCRPTLSRNRETMFAWLDPTIIGAHALDLFAGSGMLGLEALSRGAASATFVDTHPKLVQHIKGMLSKLKSDDGIVLKGRVPKDLPPLTQAPFDLVFLDPPYQQDLLSQTMAWLVDANLLKDEALILAEWGQYPPTAPKNFTQLKTKKTKTHQFGLWRYTANN